MTFGDLGPRICIFFHARFNGAVGFGQFLSKMNQKISFLIEIPTPYLSYPPPIWPTPKFRGSTIPKPEHPGQGTQISTKKHFF